jgi:hypothetical protein
MPDDSGFAPWEPCWDCGGSRSVPDDFGTHPDWSNGKRFAGHHRRIGSR